MAFSSYKKPEKESRRGGIFGLKRGRKIEKERAEPREEEKAMNGRGEKQKKISEA